MKQKLSVFVYWRIFTKFRSFSWLIKLCYVQSTKNPFRSEFWKVSCENEEGEVEEEVKRRLKRMRREMRVQSKLRECLIMPLQNAGERWECFLSSHKFSVIRPRHWRSQLLQLPGHGSPRLEIPDTTTQREKKPHIHTSFFWLDWPLRTDVDQWCELTYLWLHFC